MFLRVSCFNKCFSGSRGSFLFQGGIRDWRSSFVALLMNLIWISHSDIVLPVHMMSLSLSLLSSMIGYLYLWFLLTSCFYWPLSLVV